MYLVGFPQMQQSCSLSEIITSAFISILSSLNNSFVSNIYVGSDGKLHKVQGGADSVLPFSSINDVDYVNGISINCNVGEYIIAVFQASDGNQSALSISGGDVITSHMSVGALWLSFGIVKATTTNVKVNNAYNNDRCFMGIIK